MPAISSCISQLPALARQYSWLRIARYSPRDLPNFEAWGPSIAIFPPGKWKGWMLLGKILDGDDAKSFIKTLSGTAQIYQISRRVLQLAISPNCLDKFLLLLRSLAYVRLGNMPVLSCSSPKPRFRKGVRRAKRGSRRPQHAGTCMVSSAAIKHRIWSNP